jgi:hypothetical protein
LWCGGGGRVQVTNFTEKFQQAQTFIEAKYACFDTTGVS